MMMVREFHLMTGQPAPSMPPLQVDPTLIRLRMRLVREEYEEVMEELKELLHSLPPDATVACLRRLLKELADLQYVVEGTAVALGLPLEDAYKEVHRSNMTKQADPDGGKAVKGADYQPANMHIFIPDIIDA